MPRRTVDAVRHMSILYCSGGENVHNSGGHIRTMLAAISRILHLRLPQQLRGSQQVCAAHVPVLLLAGHEQCHG